MIKHAAVRKPLKYVTPCPEKGQRASADSHRSHREETGAEITCNLVINGRLVLIEEDGVRLRPSSQTSAPVCVPAPRLRILSKSVRHSGSEKCLSVCSYPSSRSSLQNADL